MWASVLGSFLNQRCQVYSKAKERVRMAEEREPTTLHLMSLIEGIPALTAALGGTLAEAAAVCFAHQGHAESCLLQVRWEAEQRAFALHRLPVSEPMLRAYRDLQEATE